MIQYRLGPAPPEIEAETEALLKKWLAEIADDNYIPFDEYADKLATQKWRDYMDAGRKRIAEAKAEGRQIG